MCQYDWLSGYMFLELSTKSLFNRFNHFSSMSNIHKTIDKHYSSLPLRNEVGLSDFDLDLIHKHRKRYVPVFNRKEQIFYPSEMKDSRALKDSR